MKAYRVENIKEKHGIWRNFDGTLNPIFNHLSHGKCRDMAMPDNNYYRYGNKQWFAATDNKEKLKAWFSELDLIELLKLGYEIIEFEITSCRIVSEFEICFTRDCITKQRVLTTADIYSKAEK